MGIEAEIGNDEGPGPKLSLDVEKEDSAEFQRYSTSIKAVNLRFRQALCGWQIQTKQKDIVVLNIDDEIQDFTYYVNKKSRICNEACADFLVNSINGLISHTTQLSNLTDQETHDDWDTVADAIIFTIAQNYHKEGNTFELREGYYIDIIVAYTLSYNTFTRKARGGFMVKQNTETTTSIYSNIQRAGMPTQDKGGFWNSLLTLGKNK